MAITVAEGPIGTPTDPAPDPKASERALTLLCDKRAKSRGYLRDERQDALNPRSGFPQRLYFKPGRMVAVECLPVGVELSSEQKQWAEILESIARVSNGAFVYVAASAAQWPVLLRALS